jgi:hypothetical protein
MDPEAVHFLVPLAPDPPAAPARKERSSMTISTRKGGAGLALLLLCAANFLDAMDVSTIGVALPAIQAELGMKATSLQWAVSAYVLGYGGFLLLGGRVADVFGHRRTFLWSLGIFAAASIAGGFVDSGPTLIAARLVKGIAAAFTAPAALARCFPYSVRATRAQRRSECLPRRGPPDLCSVWSWVGQRPSSAGAQRS